MSILERLKFILMYFGRPPWDTGVSPPELIDFLKSHPPGRAIDLGCGTGTNVLTLAQAGWEVTGIDFVPQAIQAARKKVRKAGAAADLRLGNVTQLDGIQGTFNLVLDIGCFHSLPNSDRQKYLNNLLELLAPGGSFLMYVFFRQPGQDGPGVSESELQQIASIFRLAWRKDGTERGTRPSAWLEYRR
jgi:SAM-dependent methyltransferase